MRMLLPLLVLTTVSALADDPCAAVVAAQKRAYGFSPAKLDAAQQQAKSADLDAFWNAAKGAGPKGLDCVRALMSANAADTYFQFDAASLLNTFDATPASDVAIEAALLRVDFTEVRASTFIDVALRLEKHGRDIGPIARRYLHARDVDDYLPELAAFKLDRIGGATILYGSMDPSLVDRYLAEEVKAGVPQYARDVAAHVWAANMTAASFQGIAQLADDKTLSADTRKTIAGIRAYHPVKTHRPKYTREQMLKKLAALPDGMDVSDEEGQELDNSMFSTFTLADLPAIRAARRTLVTSAAPEAISVYLELTRMLLDTVNALDAYAESRVH